mgnify:CR=1 FL=1|tara:strand:+ start:684 stop:1913 length:1230 start_codon:yes stop_codon:yes gene_type:complete
MIIDIIRSNFKIIIFGFVFTFFSSIGQSFFIGLFNSEIRNELNISHAEFGSIYGVATLCSSITLIWIGKKIDEFKLVKYSIIVVLLLFFSTIFFSYINSVTLLLIGIFLIRLSGQGLMAHTATTTVSRYFIKTRGKALSFTWFGMSLGEFILPVLIVFLLSFMNWRDIWIQIGIAVLIILPIFSYLTIKDIDISSREKGEEKYKRNLLLIKSWKRSEVLKDTKFYTLLPYTLACPFIITGIVINQSFIVESKGWNEYAIAQAFMFYSTLTVLTLFISGYLVDRFTSRKILPYVNIPMLFSLIILIFFDHPYTAYIFMGLLGITNGITNVLLSSLWAEIYGVTYLGSIRALTGSFMVFSTAIATVTFGFLIDLGYSIEAIAALCSIYIGISLIIILIFRNLYNPIRQKKT